MREPFGENETSLLSRFCLNWNPTGPVVSKVLLDPAENRSGGNHFNVSAAKGTGGREL